MTLLEMLLIGLLANYRLTSLLHEEAGPGDLLSKWRTSIGVRHDQYSNPYGLNWFAKGVLCFYCLSFQIGILQSLWIALFAALGFPFIGVLTLFPFAMSGGAVFLRKWAG